MKTSTSTEVLVIGGGITGALIAYSLLTAGRTVLLVDRRDVCNGSTAASTAMLQYEIDEPLHSLIEKRGLTCALESYQQCEKAIATLRDLVQRIDSDCGFADKKSIYFTRTEKDIEFLRTELKLRRKHGFKVDWLEERELKQFGLEAVGGIESASGAVIDPYKFATDLLVYCRNQGLTVFDRTTIRTITKQEGQLVAVTEDGLKITAEHVVHCSGYESTSALKKKIVTLKSTYALASESFSTLPTAFADHIYWDTASPYLYFRATADGRIIVGGADEPFKNGLIRDRLINRKKQFLQKEFAGCFPGIPFTVDYSWAGTFGETVDGLPYIGQPEPERNEHYILGFGGNGITFSVMGMEAIHHSLNHTPHRFLEYYRFSR